MYMLSNVHVTIPRNILLRNVPLLHEFKQTSYFILGAFLELKWTEIKLVFINKLSETSKAPEVPHLLKRNSQVIH